MVVHMGEKMNNRQSKKMLKNLIEKSSMELAKEFTMRDWVRSHHNDSEIIGNIWEPKK